MCSFTVIGISDSSAFRLSPEAAEAVKRGRYFSGGRRHHELMRDILPPEAVWTDITVPLADVFAEYRRHGGETIVFASGDPLFFGFAGTLQREFPDAAITVIPTFNSLQTLAHRLALPYQDMRAISLTGRPWGNLDIPLIEGAELIGALTDRNHTPAAVARRMLDYGYDNYMMSVGENLGNPERERVTTVTLAEAASMEWEMPNCLILRRTYTRPRPLGIPEGDFELLDGRVNMITKMPVRLLTLSMLDLRGRRSLWDVGFCTGSVSIEAKLQFPHLSVTAFERRPEGARLIETNSRRHGTPGIESVIGDFMEADLSRYPAPDAVFIGGHGGRLEEILGRIAAVLAPGGTVVFNSVSGETCRSFMDGAAKAGLTVAGSHRVALDDHNPITIIKAVK